MKIYYRISDGSYNKERESFITKEKCLANLVNLLREQDSITVIADNVSNETYELIHQIVPTATVYRTQLGHGALSFNYALDLAINSSTETETVSYFVEDDFLHTQNALEVIEDGLNLGFHYITGYDHPDKYLDPSQGGNPYCQGGAENTRVYLGQKSHFKVTNSTTMTFAAKIKTLREDLNTIKSLTNSRFESNYPYDFYLFQELMTKYNRVLGSSVPGVSTHGESRWLSPLVDWSKI
jgi:hypothetical protein